MFVYFQSATQRRQRLSRQLVPESSLTPTQGTSFAVDSDVQLLDVTPVDIRCVVDANPSIGDTLGFDVVIDGGQTIAVSGLVHWKELRRDSYEIGLYLPAGLDSSLTPLITDQRRKSNRYRCRQTGEITRPLLGQRADAVVVNYSQDGIAVQTECFCNVDEPMRFVWTQNQEPQEVAGQVMWQIEQQHRVLLGCRTPPGDAYRIAGLKV